MTQKKIAPRKSSVTASSPTNDTELVHALKDIADLTRDAKEKTVVFNISPLLAKHWLENNNTHNRSPGNDHVQRLARVMKRGSWRITHQGIAFDTNSRLLDGQHRLMAIVMSGKTIPIKITFNSPPDNALAVDHSMRVRNQNDRLKFRDIACTTNERAISRSMFLGLDGMRAKQASVSTDDEFDQHFIKFNSQINYVYNLIKGNKRINRGPVGGAIARALVAGIPREKIARFSEILTTGTAQDQKDKTVLRLRDFLYDSKDKGKGASAVEVYGKTQRALRGWLDGQIMRNIYTPNNDYFPRVDGELPF